MLDYRPFNLTIVLTANVYANVYANVLMIMATRVHSNPLVIPLTHN